jgi:hypothetical protein
VPEGVIAVSALVEMPEALDATTLMPSAGATRSTCGPRVEPDQTWVEERGASAPTPSTPGCDAGKRSRGATLPALPTAATTSAPESCSARSESMSAREGTAVAETLTTCAPCRRSHPKAAISPCESTGFAHEVGLRMRADSSVASGTMPTTPTSGRFATSRLPTAVPCPVGSWGRSAPPAASFSSGAWRGARRSSSTPESAMPTIIPAADRRVRWIAVRHPGNGFWASEPTPPQPSLASVTGASRST